ncbi:unnamed protein product [Sordaria macrospora k-hell]|uniref:WGS project CABT00000000 data, contig 2.90 n=1 Tax=Sordaria macrospora (strain ATCC MYA-333 / DSM 997 / K(L3346) / K-hell) TaxID=771870 RepID=F7WC02_SORMK|nr:uncharacterized protein SMAC_09426 [Sordaria macrospora k-hell]CCC14527.1 unnamed protein product [Sordaria macrospora k-hell]
MTTNNNLADTATLIQLKGEKNLGDWESALWVALDCANLTDYVFSPKDKPEPKDKDSENLFCRYTTGMELVKDLCEFTCSLGYCPKTACVCSRLGKPPTLPKPTGVQGYPTSNMDESVSGLCSFACNYGNCSDFSDYCSTKKVALAVRPASLFEPQYCDSGRARGGEERFEQLCKFSCSHGYCPFWVCVCEIEKGFANILDPTIPSRASMKSLPGLLDYGLCGFACQRGYCPTDICFDDGVYDDDEGWGPDYDPIEGEYMDFTPIEALSCDPDKAPQTLDDLVNAVDTGSIPSICWNQWALGILLQTLLGIGSEYRESLKGYDKLFSTYQKYIRESVGPQLEKFAHPGSMKSPGLKYFDCVVSINGKKYSDKQGCQYIVLERLPVDNWHIDYTLRDAKGFYAEVDEKLGIAKEWITFGEWKLEKQCDDDMYGDDGAHIRTGNRPKLCKPKVTSMSNFPIAIDKDKIEVPNPKVVMEAAMANMTNLVYSLLTGHFLVATHTNEVDSADIVTAASMPVFMLQQAVDAMNGIKKTGSDIIKQNKKNLITFILSIVLMVISIIGEIGGALFGGMAMIARIITLIDVAGSVGMTAYDIVEDPGSAPFAIMGMLMGFVGGTRSEKSLADAGKARKAMPDSAVAKLGKVFSENDRKVQKIINACTRKR